MSPLGESFWVYKVPVIHASRHHQLNINHTHHHQHNTPNHFKQPTTISMSDYKPTEHDGLRKDGQPDQRVGTGRKF